MKKLMDKLANWLADPVGSLKLALLVNKLRWRLFPNP
jgi:hypothetical protein